ncbi:MAG: N-acetyltransferase [Pseudomonadota bacterium]
MAADSGRLAVRPERIDDIPHIFALTEEAFRGRVYSDGTEQFVTDRLRTAGALSLSLVAEQDSAVVGHVAFSLVKIDGAKGYFYGLGPISVSPPLQGNGIGTKLIETGISSLQEKGARALVLIGDPNYYARFGFVVSDAFSHLRSTRYGVSLTAQRASFAIGALIETGEDRYVRRLGAAAGPSRQDDVTSFSVRAGVPLGRIVSIALNATHTMYEPDGAFGIDRDITTVGVSIGLGGLAERLSFGQPGAEW